MKRVTVIVLAFVLLAVRAGAQTPSAAQLQDATTQLNTAAAAIAAAQADLQPTAAVSTITDLQAALDAAPCGGTVYLSPAATYTAPPGGSFLGSHACTTPITITTTGVLPGRRVTGADASLMPKIRAAVTAPSAIRLVGSGYVFRGVDISGGVNAVDDEGANNTFDESFIHGMPTENHRRGILLNGSNTSVTRNAITEFHETGQDSQAICGTNGPGPFFIDDNQLEAASENVLFGGADPTVQGLVPSHITITHNTLTKPIAWRAVSAQNVWNVKNVLELKNAAFVTIRYNLLENNWSDAQAGYAVVWTVRDQDGHCTWCVVHDVTMTDNVVRHAGAGLNILTFDYSFPSARAFNLEYSRNLTYDIDAAKWQGASLAAGRFVMVSDGMTGLVLDHDTFQPPAAGGSINSFLTFQNGAVYLSGFTVTNCLAFEGTYGIVGAGPDVTGMGVTMLDHYAPGATWSGNIIVHGPRDNGTPTYPAGTTVVDAAPATTSAGVAVATLQANIPGLDLTQ